MNDSRIFEGCDRNPLPTSRNLRPLFFRLCGGVFFLPMHLKPYRIGESYLLLQQNLPYSTALKSCGRWSGRGGGVSGAGEGRRWFGGAGGKDRQKDEEGPLDGVEKEAIWKQKLCR